MYAQELFRSKERKDIKEAIFGDTGTIVEVHGPPMVGKSSLIEQVIHDLQSLEQSSDSHTIDHTFCCKNIYVLQDLFNELVRALSPDQSPANTSKDYDTFYEMNFILKLIKNIVTRSHGCRHIFVFHKCESFYINGTSFAFLSFLGEMINMFQSTLYKVHIVFSTYKRFSLSGRKTRQVNVGMLINPCDIICLLSHYAPGVEIYRYVYLCQRYLCLPKPIVQLAINYISNNVFTPKLLEIFLTTDLEFYAKMFHTRQYEVCSLLTKDELDLIDILCRTGSNPFSQGQVESLVADVQKGDTAYESLKENLVIESIDQSDQLFVHPLVLYKCSLDRTVHESDVLCKANSYKQFIGRAMMKAETNTEKHGIKGQTYGCHRLEWPYIRQLFQRAICGNFQDIFRVAVVARRLIFVLFPNEARKFYAGLFDITQVIGSFKEAAVVEACLGHMTASGADINFQLALHHLDSAIETLKHNGPTFFYKWALRRKAIILYRMSRYPESTKCFQKAKAITDCVPLSPSDYEMLSVSSFQMEEEDIIGDIYEAIPMIFTGDNANALNKLRLVNESIQDRYENHPDLEVLFNNIGLALQRGYGDLEGSLMWYTKSLKHRSLLIRINPQLMLVTLNNVAMIKLKIGDLVGAERDLQTALTIIREGIWYHYSTALTLTSLAEIKFKLGKFKEAYDSLLNADEILQKVYRANDYRLKINLLVFHYKLLLDYKDDTGLRTSSMCSDIESLVELGLQINRHMSDESQLYLMSVYEHGMVVNLGVSDDKVRAYKEMLLKHVEENDVVKDMPEKMVLLTEHKRFLDYIKNTEFDDLELDILLDNLNLTCPTCRVVNKILGQEMWLKDRPAPPRQRGVTKDQHQPLEDFSSFSDISSKTSLRMEDSNLSQGKRNAPNRRPYFFMRKYSSELVYLYHSGRDYPSTNKRQEIPYEDFVNSIGLALSGSKIINPSTGHSLMIALLITKGLTNGLVVNPSRSFGSEASDTGRKENMLMTPKLVPPDLSIRRSDYESLGVVNPSKSVELVNFQSLTPIVESVSAGQAMCLDISVPCAEVLNRNLESASPIAAKPTAAVGLKTLQRLASFNHSISFIDASTFNPNPCERDILISSNEYICPREHDILNHSTVYNCSCEHGIFNPSSEYHCACQQDILNPSSVYHCLYEQDILNPSSVFNSPCKLRIKSYSGVSSFEYLFGLPELSDWNDLGCNAIASDYLSSPCSYLHHYPPAVHSIRNCRSSNEYVWVGSPLGEQPDYQSFSSIPEHGLSFGHHGCSELLWGAK